MRRVSVGFAILVALGQVVMLLRTVSPAGAAVPVGFTDTLVATIGSPTAMAFTPDGRLLVTTQGGAVRIVQNGSLLPTAALNLSTRVCANSERGLLGVAVDPGFGVGTNRSIYLYFTDNQAGTCLNRVSKWTLGDNNLVTGGETVLIDKIHSTAGNHNGGDLNFGKDGNLYVSVGDGGCDYGGSGCGGANDAARDRNVLVGKILRITADGSIPAGNPYTGMGTARCNVTGSIASGFCQEIYAWGLRNPFRIAFDPNAATTRFYINDVGQSTWEEIDLGAAGADYGWNVREGHCATGSTTSCGTPPAGMINPIFDYGRGDGCGTITGGAFVPSGVWPLAYSGKYLFADYNCGRIFRLDPGPGGAGFVRTDFVTTAGVPVHLVFGPWNGTQALYYTTYANGGEVRRITAGQGQTALSSGSGDPGTPITVSATGAASPQVGYDVRFANTAGGCSSGVVIGGPTTSAGNGNIAATNATIPGNAQTGTRWICFVKTTDLEDHTAPTPFVVL